MEQVLQQQVTRDKVTYPLFLLGQVVATSDAVGIGDMSLPAHCLNRHVRGDWGYVCEEDWETNNQALKAADHILSAYAIDESRPCEGLGDNTLWIITEDDRSVTTFLLPEKY